MMMRNPAFYIVLLATTCSGIAAARTTFLPDWGEERVNFKGGEDDNLCARAKNPQYHYAPLRPQ